MQPSQPYVPTTTTSSAKKVCENVTNRQFLKAALLTDYFESFGFVVKDLKKHEIVQFYRIRGAPKKTGPQLVWPVSLFAP